MEVAVRKSTESLEAPGKREGRPTIPTLFLFREGEGFSVGGYLYFYQYLLMCIEFLGHIFLGHT